MVEVELSRILISETSDAQIIVLKEKNGRRSFPIVIGINEALAIDRAIKDLEPQRPLTHDLMSRIIQALDATLAGIVVNDLRSSTFYAKLLLKRNGKVVEVDSRPSDAVAMAVRFRVPIHVENAILDEVGMEDPSGAPAPPPGNENDPEENE
ncbi:MAG: bifunctional nuclease family protein [Planctomycetota bacterium]